MDKQSSEQGDKYAKRLLDRSHYSDCYSRSYRRRLSVMEALNRNSLNPSSELHYEGNPFEKEFSQANNNSSSSSKATDATDDQHEMTYVSTWPEDNNGELSSRTYDVESTGRDSLFCAKSPGGAKATNPHARLYRSVKPTSEDIIDSHSVALANHRFDEKNDPTFAIGERFGPLSSSELNMQNSLNVQYEREFERCNAQMQLQGPDEFFGARVLEICEPTIIEFHRKSTETITAADRTYNKEDGGKAWIVTDLDAESMASTALSFGSEDMRELDREIDKLQFEHDDDFPAKITVPQERISATPTIASARISEDTVDEKNSFCQREDVKSPGKPINRSSMENFDGNRKPTSPKNATFSISTNLESSGQHRDRSLSKTASFIKRHTSFLFKNLRTPKLVRRKSSAESMKKTPGKTTQANATMLTRSNTIGSSDNDKSVTKFQQQLQQVQANMPPDMDDTMASEMENFLKAALGSGQYNSTMANMNFDLRDRSYSILSNNDTYYESKNGKSMREPKSEPPKHSGTLNRTLSIYKTLTQRIREKFRKYDHNDVKVDTTSTIYQQNTIPKDLSAEMRKAIKELQDKVNVQDVLIYQTSKALQLCDSMREFTASPERVEYERLLLLASLTKKAILVEIDRLISQRNDNNNEYAYIERGEVTLKEVRLQLREDVLRRERQNGDIVEWFVVVVAQGITVWATHAIACPISSPQIYFPGQHVISGLTPDFRLSIKVYSMKLQQLQLFNHDDKYHISRSYTFGGGNKAKTPKMLRRKSVSPKQHKVKFTGIKETSFVYCGGVDLMLYDLKLPSPWPLTSVAPNSVLRGTVDLNLSCKLELSMFHAGFLTHCEETGDLSWNRRWCLLEGHSLLFWNYPREQEYKPPIYTIDLVNCVSGRIDLIDRRLCARPRTLLLETTCKTNDRDHIVVESRSVSLIARHLLSCDSNNELTEWQSKLNHVISALRDWNIIHTAHTP